MAEAAKFLEGRHFFLRGTTGLEHLGIFHDLDFFLGRSSQECDAAQE
jgi:hypothetical protein